MTENHAAQVITLEQLIAALNTRDMWINPDMFDRAAEEIACGAACRRIWHDPDTGGSDCLVSEAGNYCPNDIAETLREVAKVARQA